MAEENYEYKAFISYSHHHDKVLAPALQNGLERFAKPWRQRDRTMRIFRDTANLTVSPDLWGSVEAALGSSEWFMLLASPDAAKSEWVDREVGWWLKNRPANRMLIVATAPGLRWDHPIGDWAADAPVPPSLRGALSAVPLWADLRNVSPRFGRVRIPTERLASIVASLRGKALDQVFAEHLKQHRRTMRIVWGAVALMVALTVAAMTGGIVAIQQRDVARTQTGIAKQQTRVATGRLLADLSASLGKTHVDISGLLAVAAYQEDENAETRGALLQAATSSPLLTGLVHAGTPVTALAAAANGQVIAAGTGSGELLSYDLVTGRRTVVRGLPGAVSEVAVSANGQVIAAIGTAGAVAWTSVQDRVQELPKTPVAGAVAVSPSGDLVAVLAAAPASGTIPDVTLLVHDLATGRDQRGQVPANYSSVAFAAESSLVLMDPHGFWERIDPATFQVLSLADVLMVAASFDAQALSADGAYAGYTEFGQVLVAPTSGTDQTGAVVSGNAPDSIADALAISPDGKEAAVDESGTIYIIPLLPTGKPSAQTTLTQLTGVPSSTLLAFVGTGRVAAAAGDDIYLWNLGQVARIATATGFMAPTDSNAGGPPVLSTAPGAQWIEVVAGNATTANVTALLGQAGRPAVGAGNDAMWILPLRDGSTPMLLGTVDWDLVLADATGKIVWSLPAPTTAEPVAAAIPSGGQQLIVAFGDGSVDSFDLGSGAAHHLVTPEAHTFACAAAISPYGQSAMIAECPSAFVAGPSASLNVEYADLLTGATHALGSGGADAVGYIGDDLIVQRPSASLEVWDLTGTRRLRTLPGVGGTTLALTVSPDGMVIARLLNNGTVVLSDAQTGSTLTDLTLPVPANSSSPDYWTQTALAFTPDNRYLVTATAGGEIYKWDLSPADIIKNICTTVGRSLTTPEWGLYVGTTPPAKLPCSS